MAASIREFGFKIPVLARSDGEVVDGHLRLKAAQKLNLTEVPVVICDEWTPAQVKAFRLMVNRSATWADWDFELLELEMQELKSFDFDLQLTGFDGPEIDQLLFGTSVDDDAEVMPEASGTPISRLGDLWVCGAHRILCGDATSLEDVTRLFGSLKPELMVTDPPYGVGYDPEWRERAGLGRQRQTGLVANDDQADWSRAYQLFPGDVAYVWHAGVHAAEVAAGLTAAGLRIRAQIIWAKQHFALSRGDYHWQHEPCWYAVREGKGSNWCGDRTQSTLWEVPNLNPIGGNREEDATGHGTQKPIELMRRPILNHTSMGGIIYDPFLGSGTTLMASELCDRVCVGMDIDPAYVDMMVTRWQKQTGSVAKLETSGATFEEVRTERVDGAGEVR
jgi:DNA modification methylase